MSTTGPVTLERAIRLSEDSYVSGANVAVAMFQRFSEDDSEFGRVLELALEKAIQALKSRLLFIDERAKIWLVREHEALVWSILDEVGSVDSKSALAADVFRIMISIDVGRAVEILADCARRFEDRDRFGLFWRWGVEGGVEEIALVEPELGRQLAEQYQISSEEVAYAIDNGRRLAHPSSSAPTSTSLNSARIASSPDDTVFAVLTELEYDVDQAATSQVARRLASPHPREARSALLHAIALGHGAELGDVILELALALGETELFDAVEAAL